MFLVVSLWAGQSHCVPGLRGWKQLWIPRSPSSALHAVHGLGDGGAQHNGTWETSSISSIRIAGPLLELEARKPWSTRPVPTILKSVRPAVQEHSSIIGRSPRDQCMACQRDLSTSCIPPPPIKSSLRTWTCRRFHVRRCPPASRICQELLITFDRPISISGGILPFLELGKHPVTALRHVDSPLRGSSLPG